MKIKLRESIITILAFIIILYMYALFSYFGVERFIKDGILKDYFSTNIWHLEVIFSGTLLAILFILINHLTEKKTFRRRSFGFNILLKSALYLLALIVVCVIIYQSFIFFGLVTKEQLQSFISLLSFKFVASGLIFYVSFILLANFIVHINKKFGPGFMMDLLTGKYYHPKNENLIFMFLDLKGSTTLAEKLGHNQYSRFIKECVHELTPVIQKYNARVYQYVGDEVVLFWGIKEGFNQLNCLNTFFEFSSLLKQRSNYFISKYGETPIFKAGMDTGIVTVTEIGDIKREIAFHGDVLNTAARLEKKCNEFNTQFIVTQSIVNQMHTNNKYDYKFLSDLPLRGKIENIKFYGVKPTVS